MFMKKRSTSRIRLTKDRKEKLAEGTKILFQTRNMIRHLHKHMFRQAVWEVEAALNVVWAPDFTLEESVETEPKEANICI